MCGITGFIETGNPGLKDVESVIRAMSETLTHRGPDAGGIWTDSKAGIALGHRRLSILDLSVEGLQPMLSACGQFVIVFNGEIYNHEELRAELERSNGAPSWRGHSDTETMLAAIAHWGVEPAVKRFTGMFAFALWDRKHRVLHLVRDRLGEKPLYYGWIKNSFVFGSELKALRAHPAWHGRMNRGAVASYLHFGYIPAPLSIHQGIYKLNPGSIVRITEREAGEGRESCSPVPYWSLSELAVKGAANPYEGTEEEAKDHLDSLLRASIKRQMLETLFIYCSSQGDAEKARAIVESELRDNNLEAKTSTIEHWLEAEERWDDEPPGETWEQEELAEGFAPWEVRVECGSREEAQDLAAQLETEGYKPLRHSQYLIVGAASHEDAEKLATRLHGTVQAGGAVVLEARSEAWSRNPFALFGGFAQ